MMYRVGPHMSSREPFSADQFPVVPPGPAQGAPADAVPLAVTHAIPPKDLPLAGRYIPADYTWAEFVRAFETVCVDAWEAKPNSNPEIFLPHSVFPLVTHMINPLTGASVPITRISPFQWETQ